MVVAILALSLGERIRLLREKKGWSTYRLAKVAQVASGYISEIENGMKKNVSGVVLARIARALETTGDYLVGNTDDPELPVRRDRELTPDERLRQLGADLRSAGATEEDVKMILFLLDSRRKQEAEKKGEQET